MNVSKKLLPKQVDKRRKILEAARNIFGQKGYESTSMLEIAQSANVATGTIYEYFENKEELFFHVAAERYHIFERELNIELSGLKCSFDKIRKYIWFYLYYFQKDPIYAELWLLNIRVNKNFFESRASSWIKESGKVIVDILKAGQEEGMIREDVNLYVIRHMILGSLEHIVSHWIIKGKTYDLLSYSNSISDLIIEAIKKQNSPLP